MAMRFAIPSLRFSPATLTGICISRDHVSKIYIELEDNKKITNVQNGEYDKVAIVYM
jgi:hypothetical protein